MINFSLIARIMSTSHIEFTYLRPISDTCQGEKNFNYISIIWSPFNAAKNNFGKVQVDFVREHIFYRKK